MLTCGTYDAAGDFAFRVGLPGKSGLELCRELRTQPRGDEMFILLVTARQDTEDLEKALKIPALADALRAKLGATTVVDQDLEDE